MIRTHLVEGSYVVERSRSECILVIGGTSRSLVNFRGPLIKALIDSGAEVHAAAPELSANPLAFEKLRSWGVICHDVPLRRASLNPARDLVGTVKLYGLIKRIRPDAVLGYTIKPVIYGTIAAMFASVPRRYALITGLGYAFTGKARGKRAVVQSLVKRFYRSSLSWSSLVFFQNPDDEKTFRNNGILPARISSRIVNGSGVDLAFYSPVPLPTGRKVFLLIARLLGDKGIREYVQAAKVLRAKYPDTVFRLVGDIDDNPDSIKRDELKAWEQEGVIEYLGKLEDVRPAIAKSSVYVLPSYREGTPRTVLEAMAMGRPVITTDAPGCRETVINGVNGFIVPIKSVGALAEAMECFVRDPLLDHAMGQKSLELAANKYDVMKVNKDMLSAMSII